MSSTPDVERIADEHLDQTAYYHWVGLAQAIREQHSDGRLTGEVTAWVESHGLEFEISESFYWASQPEGDIIHALHVQETGGTIAADRERLISREV
jgi:hypothetical protein